MRIEIGKQKFFNYGDVLRNKGKKSQWHGKQECKKCKDKMGFVPK
jgi:hypothetical protein